MKPWVTKKITEYLGEEELTLINYICKKLSEHVTPDDMEGQLKLVLEDEAADFMVRMWRMLIYSQLTAGQVCWNTETCSRCSESFERSSFELFCCTKTK